MFALSLIMFFVGASICSLISEIALAYIKKARFYNPEYPVKLKVLSKVPVLKMFVLTIDSRERKIITFSFVTEIIIGLISSYMVVKLDNGFEAGLIFACIIFFTYLSTFSAFLTMIPKPSKGTKFKKR